MQESWHASKEGGKRRDEAPDGDAARRSGGPAPSGVSGAQAGEVEHEVGSVGEDHGVAPLAEGLRLLSLQFARRLPHPAVEGPEVAGRPLAREVARVDDEMGHAESLTVHLFGKGLDLAISVPQVDVSSNPIEMIQQDLEGEVVAIDRYARILDIIGDDTQFTDTRVLIEAITTDEVSHQDEFAALLRAKVDKYIVVTRFQEVREIQIPA